MFPGAFLTRLGTRALEAFYTEAALGPVGTGSVADADGRLVGFVVAVRDGPAFWRGLYRRRLPRLLGALVRRAPRDRELRAALLRRLGDRLLRVARRPSVASGSDSAASTRLLAVGVEADRRGSGLAEALVDDLLARLRRMGIEDVGLSVVRANARALAFYARTGWSVERETPEGYFLVRSTG